MKNENQDERRDAKTPRKRQGIPILISTSPASSSASLRLGVHFRI
jgi:hypothetical protein